MTSGWKWSSSGILRRRRALPVPRFEFEERRILRVDAEFLVEGDEHRIGGGVPGVEFAEVEIGVAPDGLERLRIPLRQEAHGAGGVAQVEPGHHVRVRVVVDDGRVLVGAGDPMDVERLRPVASVEPEVGPQPGGLDEDLGAFVGEEVDVAGGLQVSAQGEHHRRVDVVLRGAGGVVGRRLLAVDRPPRVERADLAHLRRPGTRRRACAQRNRITLRAASWSV